jgi:hypothetical protein
MRRRGRIRPLSVLVLALVISVFGALAFRVGRSSRPTGARAMSAWAAAASAAYSQNRSSAYLLAWNRSYGQGRAAGSTAGKAAGTRDGRSAGQAASAARADAARALAAALPPPPIKLAPGTTIDRCVPVGGGVCEVLGPAVTGRPCPSASVPNPEGGVVCVPRVLILAARLAQGTLNRQFP